MIEHDDKYESNDMSENNSDNTNNDLVTPPDAGTDINETGEYEYGISYSSSKSESNSHSNKETNKHPKTNNGRGKKIVLIAAAVAFLLVFNILSAFLGAKLSGYFSDSDEKDKTVEENTDKESRAEIKVIFSATDPNSIDPVKGSANDSNLTKKQVYSLVSDSVVEIRTETVVGGSMFGQYVTSGAGSGVIVGVAENSNDYYLLTNNHVISEATKISVRLNDGTEFDAKLVATDEDTDVAVVTITSEKELKCAKFGCSSALAVGEDVIAIGNPLGELGGSLTDGIISAVERDVIVGGISMKLLQTNVAVNPGNSGGGLFNMAGELVGIVNAKYSDYDVEGLAFAIPSETARSVMEDLIKYGYVQGRVSLGISVKELTYFGKTFVIISDPGNNSNFKEKDQICKIDDTTVSSVANVKSAISGKSIGDKVTVTVYRNGSYLEIDVVLVQYTPTFTTDA